MGACKSKPDHRHHHHLHLHHHLDLLVHQLVVDHFHLDHLLVVDHSDHRQVEHLHLLPLVVAAVVVLLVESISKGIRISFHNLDLLDREVQFNHRLLRNDRHHLNHLNLHHLHLLLRQTHYFPI